MRNLILGTLIVIGGIIAALPFRRAPEQNRPDAAEFSLATGPPGLFTANADSVLVDDWFTDSRPDLTQDAVHSQAGVPLSLASAMQSSEALRGIPSDAISRPRRDLKLPLTYEDLAVPLATPLYGDGRFDALASRQEAARHQELQRSTTRSVAAMEASPGFESLPVEHIDHAETPHRRAPWEMARDLPQSILESPAKPPGSEPAPLSPSVQGRLASDAQNRKEVTTAAREPERQRHWIRQPD